MAKKTLIALALALALGACTTTRDLERRPELVAVEGAKPQGKSGAAQQAGEKVNGANSGTEATAARTSNSGSGATTGKGDAAGDSGTSSLVSSGTQTSAADAKAAAANGPGEAGAGGTPAKEMPVAPPVIVEKKIYIEKPVYYPEGAAQPSPNPQGSVAEAMSGGVMRPKDYNGALMLYDYDSSLVYQVYTMPLRVTDIYLEPGEKVIEQPFCGDTTRWNIGGGVSKTAGVDTQHLYLKPSEEGLETTLIVNTDRRIYHLIIKSFKDTFMLAVMWHYQGGMPHDFLSANSERDSSAERGTKSSEDRSETTASAVIAVDPALMSSDYTVSYPKGNAPQWLPTLVLDDGEKTYIVLPDTVVHHELPAVFGENGELLNFRVKDNVVVVDRLLRKMQLKLRDVTVEIRKKGA